MPHSAATSSPATWGGGGLDWEQGDGRGVHVTGDSAVNWYNSILVSHTVGISVMAGSTARLEGTLWYGNGQDSGGAGAMVTGTVNVTGDPAFADPQAGDYHLGAASAARDAGVRTRVRRDMEGDVRPQGVGVDMGADEYVSPFAPSVGSFAPEGGSGRVGEWAELTTSFADPDRQGDPGLPEQRRLGPGGRARAYLVHRAAALLPGWVWGEQGLWICGGQRIEEGIGALIGGMGDRPVGR